jgi:hypothetical protein
MRRLMTVIAILVAGAGCDEFVYPCHSDANCVVLGAQGKCLSAGSASYCAFPYQQVATSPNQTPIFCPSSYRWDTSAPEELQGSCVVLQSTDGGTD